MNPRRSGPVRVGVIGCGTIAYWGHLRSLQSLDGAILASAADPDPAARARARPFVKGQLFESALELLSSQVDAVIVSVPNALHAELTIAAARAGKHVYVEKPLATTMSDARSVTQAVAASGVVAAVGFNYRHHPAHQRARALLKEGRIGAVRTVQSAFCEPLAPDAIPDWKRHRGSGGGSVLDLASHHVDLIRWFLDDEVAAVSADIASTRTDDDNATLRLTMRRGIEALISVSFLAGPADFLEFIGERGTLRVDRHALTPSLRVARRHGYGVRSVPNSPNVETAVLWLRRIVRPSYEPSFRRALAAFIDRINGGPAAPATVDDGVRSLAVVLAAEESVRRMTPVAVA